MAIFPLAPDQTIAQMWLNGVRGGEPMYDFLLVTSLIVTLALSATVFEILTLKARESLNFPDRPLFEAPVRVNPL